MASLPAQIQMWRNSEHLTSTWHRNKHIRHRRQTSGSKRENRTSPIGYLANRVRTCEDWLKLLAFHIFYATGSHGYNMMRNKVVEVDICNWKVVNPESAHPSWACSVGCTLVLQHLGSGNFGSDLMKHLQNPSELGTDELHKPTRLKTRGGPGTQKQNDSKHLGLMIVGGTSLPSLFTNFWGCEIMNTCALLGAFHLRTTLVVQLSMKLDSRRQWPERNREREETKRLNKHRCMT